jgi:hypothetical protein
MKGRNFIRFNSGKKAAASPARSQKKTGRKNNNMLKGAGILALVLVGATSLGLITGQNGSVNGGVKIVKASSLPHIDSLKSQMANSANKSVINILEIVPEKNVTDSNAPMYSGELGYLVEGQEGVNFESVLTSIKDPENKVSGKSLREKWANNYLTSLVSLGIMSDSSDAKVDEYPLTANYVDNNNGVKTYYKELYPWDYDALDEKDKEGYKPLSVKDFVKAKVGKAEKDDKGSWIAPPASFTIDPEGNYRQDISELKNATEDILSKDLSKYLFYKADEDNLHVYSSTELSKLDPTSGSTLSKIFFRRRTDDKDDEWSYTDVSTGFDHDYTYASLNTLDKTTVMTGKDFKAAVDNGSVTLSDWYCSDGDIIKAVKDEQHYLNVDKIKTEGVTLTYAGPGKGNCSLSGSIELYENGSPDGSDDKDLLTLSFNKTYYKGGYSNNNWFLRYVMNYDENDVSSASDKDSALKDLLSKRAKSVKIDSAAAPDVLISKSDNSQTGQSLNLSDYDMIYISDGIGLCLPANGSTDQVGNVPLYSDAAKYSNTPDADQKVYDISIDVSRVISGTYASNLISQSEIGLGKFVMYDTDILTGKDGANVSDKASKSNASGLIYNLMKKRVYDSSVSGDDLIDAASSTVNGQNDDKFKDGYVYKNSFGFTVNKDDTTVTGGRQSSVSAAFNKPYDNKRYTDASSGFFDVYEEITHENNVSVTTGGKKFLDDTSLDEADVLRYAINYSGRRPNNKKSVINVLDIEPDKWSEITERNTPGTGDGSVHASDDFRKMLGNGIYKYENGKDSIRITTMSVAEFIGKTEDIAEKYDMVYIGGDKNSNLHKNLLRNDKGEYYKEFLYYNIGPEYNIENEAGQGMLDTDYNNYGYGVSHDSAKNNLKYRKSGNDLSKAKMKELIKYADLGYPVILGGDLAENSHTFYLRAASKNGQRVKSVSLKFYKDGNLVANQPYSGYKMEEYSSSDDDNLWYFIASNDILDKANGVQATIKYGDNTSIISKKLTWDNSASIPNMISGCSGNEKKIMGETIDNSWNGDSLTVYLWNADGWVAPKIEAVYGYDQSSIKSRDYDMEKVNTNLWKCVIPRQADNTLSYYSYYDSTKTNTSGPIRDLNSGKIFIAQQADGSGTYDNSYSWSTFDKAGNSDHEIDINEKIADNTSYMYQALMSVRHNDNLMGYYYAKQNPLKVYYAANLSKPEINFLRFTTDDDSNNKNGDQSGDTNGDGKFSMEDGTPVNYHSGDAELSSDKLQYTLVKNENSDTFTMKWHLQIVNATEPDVLNNTYSVHLYLDSNGDGLFNEDEEISNLSVTNDSGTISSNGKSFENSADGSAPAKTFNLKCGLNTKEAPVYTISRDIPTGVHGVIPWKLMVESNVKSNGETGFHASETGYSYFRSDKKDQIKVLQIRSDNKNGADLSAHYIKNQKIDKIQDFDITIDTVRPKSGISWNVNGGQPFNSWNYDMLKDYDMIICGFGDSWGDLDNNGANLLAQYIDDGRPLMVAHDTASFNNMRKDLERQRQYMGGLSAWNSFWFNDILRDKVKLDVYGVSNRYSYNEAGVKVKNDGIQIGGQKYKGKYYNNQYGISYYDDPTYLYNSGVVAQGNPIANKTILSTIQNAGYRVAYDPGKGVWDDSTKSSTTGSKSAKELKSVNNTQGYTNFLIDWVRSTDNNKYGGLSTTTQVEQVNKGQLTTYPFDVNTKNFDGKGKLKDSEYMEIDQTHFQYYQLNMDADKIVCWYTLANGQSNRYAYSPQDVVNQYYIFSCGNITYTGAGHSNNMSDDETNLFINTMIAAYRKQQTGASASFMASAAGDQKLSNGTTVVLTNKDSMKDYDDTSDGKTRDNQYNYGMFGDTSMNGSYPIDQRVTSVGGGTARVYFRVTNPNIGSSYIGVRFDYMGADQGGNKKNCIISADKYQSDHTESGYTIHRADGSDETYDPEIGIRSGITYYIDLPESLTNWLNSDKNTDHSVELELKATVYNTDTGNEIASNGDDNVAKIKLSSMNLFPIG